MRDYRQGGEYRHPVDRQYSIVVVVVVVAGDNTTSWGHPIVMMIRNTSLLAP